MDDFGYSFIKLESPVRGHKYLDEVLSKRGAYLYNTSNSLKSSNYEDEHHIPNSTGHKRTLLKKHYHVQSGVIL